MSRRVHYAKPYRLLARGECKDFVYDYFVAFNGAFIIQKDDYITFHNGWRWFKGYFKGYTLRVCRRLDGRLERRGFMSMMAYDNFKWSDVVFRVDRNYSIGVVLRRVGGRWVSVFPRE
jgi:hypothetical protein